MQTLDHEPADYGTERKAKVSRARKAVLGLMAIGVIAAVAGAGTFASFSASTTNDTSFEVGHLSLTEDTGDDTCTTPAGLATGEATSAEVDVNEAECDGVVFEDKLYPGGDAAEGEITLTNDGEVDGLLSAFGNGDCTPGDSDDFAAGSGDPCDRIAISIGTATACLFPQDSDNPCDALDDSSLAAQSLSDFDAVDFGDITDPIDLADGASATVTVSAYMVPTTGDTDCGASIGQDDSDTDGFGDDDGQGCDNPYMNRTVTFGIRWHLAQA